MAEKACHGFGSTTQVGLTQALGLMSSAWSISKLGSYSLLAQAALMLVATLAAGFKLFLLFLLALQLSLLGGLVSFVLGIAASITHRHAAHLWVSAAAVLVVCITLFIGLTYIGFGV